ncbi:hypothetical protein SLS60_011081 [Paraconiothyrium brasiliense]|uniref:Uncharacterized protein n=1 Tax=Paraconiothyrium brasiliense TaxID=300254 RepID=A0ABR3QKK0_9PLEO
MNSPSTSQKRKFDAYDSMENWGETEGATDQEAEYMGQSPTKRIRASGTFEPIASVMKRKEGKITVGFADVGKDERGSAKKRRR